ncbi:unnamed protein product, partial [marine sediment metagenome]
EEDDNFILGRNSFTWTSFAARSHDVMVYVKVFEVNVRYSTRPLKISILNLGTHNESFLVVRLYINGEQVFADVVSLLNTSSLIEIEYDWMPLESGFANITVLVEAIPGETWLIDNHFSTLTEVIDWFIEIDSDADFESQGWPGSGTEEDPYRIENLYMMSLASFSRCIIIEDTSVYFIIQNCTFTGEDIADHSGITMWNVTNGQILNNTFTHCKFGIWGREVFSFVFANNTFKNCWKGFWMEMSLHNDVIQNVFESNDDAIWILRMNFTTFENNTLRFNINGLFIDFRSNETQVRWNTFIDNDQNAVDDGEFISSSKILV